jgi:hypothetical protein
LNFIKTHVADVEIDLDNIVYKLYFPILTKSENFKNNPKYLNIQSNELENYIYFILNNYDEINIENTQNEKIDNYFKIPLIKLIVSNGKMFKTISLIVALFSNFMIIVSYSNFFSVIPEGCYDKHKRLCPGFLFNELNYKSIN